MVASIPGRFSTGTLLASANNAAQVIDVIRQELLAYTVNGLPAWQTYQTIASVDPARDFVMLSRGDPALLDRWILIRLQRVNGSLLNVDPLLDWSTASSSGRNENVNQHTCGGGSIEWWAQVNEYSGFFVFDFSGTSGLLFVYFGQPLRTHVPSNHQGTCFSTGAVTAGAGAVIPIDRNMTTNLQVGEGVDIVPIASPGAALPSPFVPERVVISAVGPTSITVVNLANNQPANCIIGDDPCPTFAKDGGTLTSAFFSLRRNVSVLTTYTHTIAINFTTTLVEGDIDPEPGGVWEGSLMMIQDATNGFRGTLMNISAWGQDGTQSLIPPRFWRHDHDDRQAWLQFSVTSVISISGRIIGMRVDPTQDTFEDEESLIHGEHVFSSGTIAAGGVVKMQEFHAVVVAQLLAHPAGAWSVYQNLGPGGGFLERVVLRSTGRGDTRIYLALFATSTNLSAEAYLDWSTSSGTGRNPTLFSQYAGSNTNQVDWAISVSEYGFAISFTQGANIRIFTAGQTFRCHIPPHHRGTAFSTGAVLAGANVSIPVDRDLRGRLQIGGRVDVVALALSGAALPTFNYERPRVVDVLANAVVVDTLVNNQPANCLIGDDPIPTYRSSFSATTLLPIFVIQRTSGVISSTSGHVPIVGLVEAANDPDLVGRFHGTRPLARPGTEAQYRGCFDQLALWTEPGGLATGDTFTDVATGQNFYATATALTGGFAICIRRGVAGGTQRFGVFLEVAHSRRQVAGPFNTQSADYDDGNLLMLFPELNIPPPLVPFSVIFATPINSNTIRVFLTREPRHFSPLAIDDALRRTNWTVILVLPKVDPRVDEPEIEQVENPLPAADYLATLGIVEPEAWSVDIRLARRIVASERYEVTVSAAVLTPDGSAVDPAEDSAITPGRIGFRGRRSLRPPATRTESVDLKYDTFTGVYQLDPRLDIDTHGGDEALRKRIIRRIVSTPGGFRHLEDYGAGMRVKELMNQTEVAGTRARILEQVKREEEVLRASVDVRFGGGVLFISVTVKARSGTIRIGLESSEPGQFVVV